MCDLWSFRNSKILKYNVIHILIVIICLTQYLLSQFLCMYDVYEHIGTHCYVLCMCTYAEPKEGL